MLQQSPFQVPGCSGTGLPCGLGRESSTRPLWRLHEKRKSLAGCFVKLVLAAAWCFVLPQGLGQELEPRAYSVSPVGTNFVVFAYGRSAGDLSFDPTLPIEDAKASINAASVGYFRSINFLGRSANVTLAVPYSWGSAEGRLAGEFQAVTRSGLPDTGLRFAINLVGAPAMDLKEFVNYTVAHN